MRILVTVGTESIPVEVEPAGAAGRFRVRLGEGDGEWLEVDSVAPPGGTGPHALLLDGASYLVDLAEENREVVATVGGRPYRLQVEEPGRRPPAGRGRAARRGGERLVAPMPGRVVAVHVRPGDRVEAGAPLVVLEAMKMENEFRAAAPGVVTEVRAVAGEAVNAGDLLVAIGSDAV